MLITVSNISYTYQDAPAPALVPITASFAPGWTGVVGSNGSGKSTLLRILCAELPYYSGTMTPPGVSGVYCAQETEQPPPLMEDFALDYQAHAVKLRRSLGVEDDWAWRYNSLSHGERKRLQIAAALWRDPAILALDEPTNHVDAPTRDIILATLRSYSGVGLLVSHDRDLLDQLCTQCLFIRATRATLRSGSYTQGHEQETLERLTAQRERKAAKSELSNLHAEKTRRAGEAARADARRSARHLAKGDSDGRARLGLAIVSGQDGKAGRLSAQLDGRMAAVQERLASAQVEKQHEGSVWLETRPSRRKVLVELPAASLRLGDERTLSYPHLSVGPTDHIGLTGPNGAGKSTLLRSLLQRIPEDIPYLFIPQEVDAAESRGILQSLKGFSKEVLGGILNIVARLGSDPARLLSGESLSPG
ncbi:MAG: ATP-binding cassette domain-containing protein, partial [Coriobacteriales bacterium]|nr:ATP-binding cassette domain-containing protein [Coriobacteriales bacterium]